MTPLPELRDAYLASRATEKLTAHTTRRITTELDAIAAFIGADLTAQHLTPAAVSKAFTAYSAGKSKSTVAGCISTWSTFVRWLVLEGHLDVDPMQRIERPKLPKPTPKALSGGTATVDRLIQSIRRGERPARRPWPERDLAVIATFAASGARRDEAARLNIVDLDRAAAGAQLRITGKGGAQRWVPVGASLVVAVDNYQRTRVDRFPPKIRTGRPADDAPLLVSDTGGRLSGRQLYWIVKQCFRAAGIAGQVPAGAMVHALRHTYATGLAEQGVAATDLQALLGHGSLATSQIYVSVTQERLRAVADLSPVLAALDRPPVDPQD